MTPTSRPEPETLLAHAEFVASIAKAAMRGSDLADDVAQETWVAALQGGPRRAGALKSWLRGVTRRQAANLVRKRSAQRKRDKRAVRANTAAPSTAELVVRAETGRALVAAVLSLEVIYCESLLLRYYEGLSASQIADHLGVPQETVRTRLKRGLGKLREQLASEYGGDRGSWMAALAPVAAIESVGPGATAATGMGGVIVAKKMAAGVLLVLLGLGVVLDPLGLRQNPDDAPPHQEAPEDLGAQGQSAPVLQGADEGGNAATSTSSAPFLPSSSIDQTGVDREHDLHGVLLSADDGKPVAGAALRVVAYPWQQTGIVTRGHHRDERLGAETRSAVDGTFRIPLERGAVVNLRIDAPKFARTELRSLRAGERVEAVLSRGIRLRVRITDDEGTGISGATVRMFGGDHREIYRVENTAEDGIAVFDRLVDAVEVTLDAKHPQYGDSGWTRYTLPSDDVSEQTLVLPDGRTVRGMITDADTGKPIAGARVGMGWTATNQVTTDEDGNYVLPGWTGKGVSSLTALAEGYGVMDARVDERDVIDFALSAGAELLGRVVDEHGHPVAGAQVAALSVQNVKRGHATSKRVGYTDGEGRFILDSIRTDLDVRLLAMRDGEGRQLVRIPAERLAGRTLDVGDLQLAGSRTVSGVVVDANGVPAARLPVTIGHLASAGRGPRPQYTFGRVMTQRTDDLGRFYFRDLLPGPHRLSVRVEGESSLEQRVTIPAEGDPPGVRVVVPATRALRITARTPDGRPIPALSVHVQGAGVHHAPATTDEEGTAVVRLRAEAQFVSLGFPLRAYSRYVGVTHQRITPGQDEMHFVLREARPARGTIVGPDSEPLGRLSLAVEIGGERIATRESDESGHFEVPIPLGEQANLVLTGRASRKTASGAIQVVDAPYRGRLDGVGAGEVGLVVRARKLMGDRRLRVRVLLPSGAPARGAHVYAQPSPSGRSSHTTDDEGRVELIGLVHGPTTIRASYYGRDLPENVGALPQTITPDGQEITLHIREGVLLRGIALDAEGEPLAGVEIRVQTMARDRWPTTSSGADGIWAIRLAPEDGEKVTVGAAFTTSDGKLLTGNLAGVDAGSDGVRLILGPAKDE